MGVGGEFVPEVAEGVLDLAEGLVVGQLGEFVGHAFEGGVATEELEDTLAAGVATGFQFGPLSSGSLRQALGRACEVFRRPKDWAAMQRQAKKSDVSWDTSAARYAELYRSLLPEQS